MEMPVFILAPFAQQRFIGANESHYIRRKGRRKGRREVEREGLTNTNIESGS